MQPPNVQKDSPGWIVFVWSSFFISVGLTSLGIYFMPTDLWVKGFLVMGLLFSVGSTFSLAKTMRDSFESQRIINRVVDAKTEKILHDYELRST